MLSELDKYVSLSLVKAPDGVILIVDIDVETVMFEVFFSTVINFSNAVVAVSGSKENEYVYVPVE